MDLGARATSVKFLIRDRAGQFTSSFNAVFTAEGIRILTSPPQATAMEAKLLAARSTDQRAPMRDRAPHIQAAITVLGRLPAAGEKRSCGLSRVNLVSSDLGRRDLAEADLHYSDLSSSFLRGTDLRRADLTGVWFVRAVLIGARLHQADLRSAVLWQARLEDADLRATDLTAADLTGARLNGARLDLADLRGADFSQADLTDTTFRDAVADDTTIWPTGFDPQHAGILPAEAAPPLRPKSYFEEPWVRPPAIWTVIPQSPTVGS